MNTQNIYIRYGKTASDATAQYYITLAKPMTVGEFITEWLTTGEWGYFGIRKPGVIFGDPQCEYMHGKIIGKGLPEEYLNKPIKNVYGSGGWSRSDFEFEVEETKMKKLFVSVPMKGRKEEEIRKSIAKMHKIAEAIVGEELELIDSYIVDNPPKDSKEAVWFLGKSIELLSTADVFITISDRYAWNGCYIEASVAERYGIKEILIRDEDVMDDYYELQKKMYENVPVCHVSE